MNLKLKRLVRTSNSEQYALFDLDQINHRVHPPPNDNQSDINPDLNPNVNSGEYTKAHAEMQLSSPTTIGKFDLHYTNEGAYGTLLMWGASAKEMSADERRTFIYALIDEIVQPMGVPGDYVIEFFVPELDNYEVFHNVDVDEDFENKDIF